MWGRPKMPFLLQLLELCSGENKGGDVGFAFTGGVPKGKFCALCNHTLLIIAAGYRPYSIDKNDL